ncbi:MULTISPECIES: caspase family protein [Streptomyces]|uniref:Caspase family protein n=1 Tax=Streptomyces caniscabiei TaxID=2746961 RepID=A0ABU4MRE4_9ACTN|nr:MULTISPECIES: caspase family protein [Streptomyces]MBE4734410.1 caspase family protein [Streptomyces caniscabiei]MBE4755281.1 caspase family protein [Streptomyces caniscabiei]MBE4771361.1 caspase family protein [Streptomyces caniscabiei]MBE4783434.1 caspase family protein [Streptomyces caniscabiei]MBE4792738.1 caspase family protein [Streptomyces caniscabiei]
MTRRAVLIGAETYGLTGVHTDVELMGELLAGHDFTDIRIRTGDRADYTGIGEALRGLHTDATPDDALVVYYSGHGALLGELQCLVPVDMADSTATDFRGYLAEELTSAVRALTEKTPNVTVVIDACHSSGAVREAAYAAGRAALRSVEVTLERSVWDAGFARLRALSGSRDPLVPGVVRLTACQRHASAYEAVLRPGAGRQGVFTAALAEVLGSPWGRELPWSVLITRIRDLVKQRHVRQWPEAGGPAARLPFSLTEPPAPERLPLSRRDGHFVVPGGSVFGLGRGDTVSLRFPAVTHRAPSELAVPAVVDGLRAGDAVLRAVPGAGGPSPEELRTAEPPPGSYALPVEVHDRRNVLVDVEGSFADALRAEMDGCPRLAETTRVEDAFATVRAGGGGIEVLDRDGHPFRTPAGEPVPAEPARVAALLEELARGERVRRLADPGGAGRLVAAVEVRFDIEEPARSGTWRPWRAEGVRLYDGDRYRVAVANRSAVPLYFWVIGVGLSGRVTLVTEDQPSGVRVEPWGAEHGSTSVTPPVEVYWPVDVPRRGPRPETVHVLVGDRAMDLGGLASPTARERVSRDSADPGLDALLREVWDGVRDQRPLGATEFHHRVWTVHADAFPDRGRRTGGTPRPGAGT